MSNSQFKRDIFSIIGLPPEVLAVAMAKYSRSAKSIKETIDELTEEKSAEFHEKWVLGYGDASVADMAVIAVAFENVSILASKAIEDNRLASYQEKSTRYQIFDTDRYYQPASIMASPEARLYQDTASQLFRVYNEMVAKMQEYYQKQYPKPVAMKDKAYQSKLKARSCDVARYVLPAATLTNFGMIANARTFRNAIAKFLGHSLPELREIGEDLKKAATSSAYNPQAARLIPLLSELENHTSNEVNAAAREIIKAINLQVKGAPTLIQHTEPKEYLIKTGQALREKTEIVLSRQTLASDEKRLDYIADNLTIEDELVATLMYSSTNFSFGQLLRAAQGMSQAEKQGIIELATAQRTKFDWPTRHFEVGGNFVFDTLMDYGAFRDLQRHRLCTQINQELTVRHGYEIPYELGAAEAGLENLFKKTYQMAADAWESLQEKFPEEARYIIPLGFRKRTLFKMNLRELFHIVELRTKPGGHISYRSLCYQMYEEVKKRHPLLVQNLRAIKPDFPNEFFER